MVRWGAAPQPCVFAEGRYVLGEKRLSFSFTTNRKLFPRVRDEHWGIFDNVKSLCAARSKYSGPVRAAYCKKRKLFKDVKLSTTLVYRPASVVASVGGVAVAAHTAAKILTAEKTLTASAIAGSTVSYKAGAPASTTGAKTLAAGKAIGATAIKAGGIIASAPATPMIAGAALAAGATLYTAERIQEWRDGGECEQCDNARSDGELNIIGYCHHGLEFSHRDKNAWIAAGGQPATPTSTQSKPASVEPAPVSADPIPRKTHVRDGTDK